MMHIRVATAGDVPSLLPLVESYWEFERIAGFGGARVSEQLARLLSDSRLGCGWIALADGKPAGYLLAVNVFSLEHQGLTAEIDELFVARDHRGQGVGGQLLDAAEASFRARGCTNVFLQVGRDNEEARAFYRSRGFGSRNGFDLVDKDL